MTDSRTIITVILLSISFISFGQRRNNGQKKGLYFIHFEHSWGANFNNWMLEDEATNAGYEYNSPQHRYPATGITLQRFMNSRLALTMTYSMQFLQYWSQFDNNAVGRTDWHLFTIALGARYTWRDRGILYQYFDISLGYTYANVNTVDWTEEFPEPSNLSLPAFHVTALGSRIGKKYGVELGLGYGYKGILNLGFFFRLN
ncbi:MAG: hypothetical protein HWE14_10580 [Flavobacteriia bacterium]|nr:hypothetical protein [Flavobacteriia bacterium]